MDKQIVAGANHTCVLWKEGADDFVKCWGAGGVGQLGQGSANNLGDNATPNEMGSALPPIVLGTGRSALQIAAGGNHTCARLDNNSLKCWGNNQSGQLGLEHGNAMGDAGGEMAALPVINVGTGRSIRQVATGKYHTCALLDDTSVKCWGWNDTGQLGIPAGSDSTIGNDVGGMGDALAAVDLGTGRSARQIAAGSEHTCALLDDYSVKCWGDNRGKLGQGVTNPLGDGAGEMGDNLMPIDLGTGRTARQIDAGTSHTCALLDDASVKCWGLAGSGFLGQDDDVAIGAAAGQMGDNLPAINLGANRTARQIALGAVHTCALLDNGSVKCWGEGSSGQLGQGNPDDVGDDSGEMAALAPINLGTGRTAVQIAAGDNHTCALLDDDSVKCWGAGGSGQLGQGNANNLGDAGGEMGDSLLAIVFR